VYHQKIKNGPKAKRRKRARRAGIDNRNDQL